MSLALTRALRDSGPSGCEGDYQSCTIVQFDTALTQSPTQSQIIHSLPGHETPHVTSK